MSVHLLVLDGKHKGLQIKLPPTQFVIGRDPKCHLRPTSSDVSRFHCAIAVSAGHVHVRDLKSCNGTFVNGQKVTGSVRVTAGDELRIGPLKFQLTEKPDAVAVRSDDSTLNWLLRTPDADEHKALDPSMATAIGLSTTTIRSADNSSETWRADAAHPPASAIGGDFLREYLKNRKRSPRS